jgi:hypothetical protein
MLGPDEGGVVAAEAAILEEDYETAATLMSTLASLRSGASDEVTVAEYRDWLQHLIARVKTQREHLSQRLGQLRPEGYGRVSDAPDNVSNKPGWLGCMALLGCFLMGNLYAADQKSSLERQLGAAKRQRDAIKVQKSSGSFYQTPWLSEITGRSEVGTTSAENSASQGIGNASVDVPNSDCPRIEPEELEQMIARAPLGPVSSKLVSAVIAQESGGKPCALSHKGAMGLMQIMPELASDLKLADPFDPEQNISAGVRHLSQLMERYRGDLRLVLAAYNAGPARVDSTGGVPEIEETKAYVATILQKVQP